MSPLLGYRQSPLHIKRQADAHRQVSVVDGRLACMGCKKNKTISEFYKSKNTCTGFTYLCKQCENEKVRKHNLKNRLEHPRRTWARKTLSAHRSAGHIVLISTPELEKIAEETDYCFLCGEILIWGGNAHTKRSPSLDRLYNENILRKDNTAIVCYECNRTKGDLPLDRFLTYCQLIVNKFTGGFPINNREGVS